MASGRLRIIAGELRGRRLAVPAQRGLRPTPERVRETLFNWLQPHIPASRCLDLFAGSGALGLEARSRGAAEVVLIERADAVARALRETARSWRITGVEVCRADALRWLEGPARPFDIVFLDPPFASGLLEPACQRLAEGGWLAPGARVYLEAAAQHALPPLPGAWTLTREGRAGDVAFALAVHEDPSTT